MKAILGLFFQNSYCCPLAEIQYFGELFLWTDFPGLNLLNKQVTKFD